MCSPLFRVVLSALVNILVVSRVSAIALSQTAAGCDDTEGAGLAALIVQFDEGRELRNLLRSCGAFWTPEFPRIPGAVTAREGLPLTAIKIEYRADKTAVTASVSLIYGWLHEKEIMVVDRVRLQRGDPATVGVLTDYGVRPITLKLEAVSSRVPDVPIATSASSALEVRVTVSPKHEYVLHVTNSSTRAVMAFALEGRRVDRLSVRATPMHPYDEPLIPPGGSYEYGLSAPNVSPGPEGLVPSGYSELAITAVRWDDGVLEGAPEFARSQAASLSGKRTALQTAIRLLTELASDPDLSFQTLRERLNGMEVYVTRQEADRLQAHFTQIEAQDPEAFRASMAISGQIVKGRIVKELDQLTAEAAAPSPDRVAVWISDMRASCDAWLRRLPERF